jgi:hypothetical protein
MSNTLTLLLIVFNAASAFLNINLFLYIGELWVKVILLSAFTMNIFAALFFISKIIKGIRWKTKSL